jgi:hypothetical protein
VDDGAEIGEIVRVDRHMRRKLRALQQLGRLVRTQEAEDSTGPGGTAERRGIAMASRRDFALAVLRRRSASDITITARDNPIPERSMVLHPGASRHSLKSGAGAGAGAGSNEREGTSIGSCMPRPFNDFGALLGMARG